MVNTAPRYRHPQHTWRHRTRPAPSAESRGEAASALMGSQVVGCRVTWGGECTHTHTQPQPHSSTHRFTPSHVTRTDTATGSLIHRFLHHTDTHTHSYTSSPTQACACTHTHTDTRTHTESRYLNASLGTHHYRFSCSVRSHELLTLKARLG